jgi:hypothetical protein
MIRILSIGSTLAGICHGQLLMTMRVEEALFCDRIAARGYAGLGLPVLATVVG